jgi:methylated-DNA-[protein]-cysteine S-methyltransferase
MANHAYEIFETSWGWIGVIGSPIGICYASLPETTPEKVLEWLAPGMHKTTPAEKPGAFREYQNRIEEYFIGQRLDLEMALDLTAATPFFKRAWSACQSIPAGETRSYKWLALQAGCPNASRAAGQAMARNRVPLVIPCHRVIGTNGSLHGFGGGIGLDLKSRLLEHESTFILRNR